jgi:hypothetical protein
VHFGPFFMVVGRACQFLKAKENCPLGIVNRLRQLFIIRFEQHLKEMMFPVR